MFGLIDYRNWKYNPDKINFKRRAEDVPILFRPADVAAFNAAGETYVSGIVDVEVSPTQTSRLTYDAQLKIETDTTFLQNIFTGEKSLYHYENADGRESFYVKQDAGFDLLIYKRYLKKQDDGKRVISENKKYLNQLILYLNDCASINAKLANTTYDQSSLTKLFQQFYACTQQDVAFQKKKDKIRVETGLLAGASSTSLKFVSDGNAYLVNAGYPPSTSVSAAVFVDVVLPRNQGKWSINNEVLFSSFSVKGSYENFKSENDYDRTTTELGFSYLKINNLLRFKYPVGSLFLFLNGGVSNGIAVSETNYKKRESKFFSTSRITETQALIDVRRYEQGFIVGTGVRYNRFSAEARLEKGNGMSSFAALRSLTTRYFILIGFRL